MGDHVVLSVNGLETPESSQLLQGVEAFGYFGESTCSLFSGKLYSLIKCDDVDKIGAPNNERKPLIPIVECRICHEEDSLRNVETPCACSGSLKFAHRKCVQRWCNEKGDATCEICHQPYQPGYTAPPQPPPSEGAVIDISGRRIHEVPTNLHDPRLPVMAAAERRLLEAEYDEYSDPNAIGAAFFRPAALILLALVLLMHALTIGNGDDDASTFFSRTVWFLLPCYMMAYAVIILRRRQAQAAAAVAQGRA